MRPSLTTSVLSRVTFSVALINVHKQLKCSEVFVLQGTALAPLCSVTFIRIGGDQFETSGAQFRLNPASSRPTDLRL